MGLLCAAVGALTGLWISITAIGDGYGVFIVAAPLAAFLSGCFFWWLLVLRRGRLHRVVPALAAGSLAAVFGHFLCWYLLLSGSFVWSRISGQAHPPGWAPVNPLQAVPAAGLYAAISLVFYGWVTIPAGALIGLLLALVQRRRNGGSRSPPG